MVKLNSITPKTSFLCSCCGDSLNPPKTDLPTKYPPTNRPTDALIMFNRHKNSEAFTLQNTNTAGKM